MRFWLVIFLLMVPVVGSMASTGNLEQRQVSPQYLRKEAFEPAPGFNAALIVTPGDEFDRMLNSSPDNRPDFTRVDVLKAGEQAELHVIFTNPLVDENSFADVTFDAKIIKPGKVVKSYTGLEGITGKLQKSSTNAYLARAFLRLKADNSDPIGEWNILITIHDNKRQSSISDSVKITFVR
ncbi:hypothetical protein [Geobacter sulfurreducens]|uniref:hypothetical protein n=1 Tax=Geobacter sulfurreducens TaxID=35554 RepID=UPI002BA0B64B|nr:hypothetical protein [Geobacter sulfurreducens]HML79028.1 hypothetical protein [Geobacter sulfurreducens]